MNKQYIYECAICGYKDEHSDGKSLIKHIKLHDISQEDYYNKYVKDENDNPGVCIIEGCNNKTKFRNIISGYANCCCRSHTNKYSWIKGGEDRRLKQIEIGRKSMNKINDKLWNSPEYEEFRCRRSDYQSEVMTKRNTENWKDPNYRVNKIEQMHNNGGVPTKGAMSIYYNLNGSEVLLQSSLELEFVQNTLGIIERSKYRINWYDDNDKLHTYFPDFDLTDPEGNKYIVEVKPYYLINDNNIMRKEFATIKYLIDNNLNINYIYYCGSDGRSSIDLSDPNIIKYRYAKSENWIVPDHSTI